MDFVLFKSTECGGLDKELKYISNNTVIDNQGFIFQTQCVNDEWFLEGGLIYIEDNKLHRVGKSVNSYQTFIRKKICINNTNIKLKHI